MRFELTRLLATPSRWCVCQFRHLGILKKRKAVNNYRPTCDPAGIRTQDPNIKSVMLYQLSYGILLLKFEGAKIVSNFSNAN